MRTASTLLLKQLSALLALCLLLVQPSYTKERIRYHINGPDGSTLRVVDQKGVAVAAYRYAPFGAQLIRKKPRNLHGAQGFVTGIHEANNLIYLKHRYYNPVIGRFYQPDPVTFLSGGMGQINRYQYGWNDPLTFKDPNGTNPAALFAGAIWILDNFRSDTPNPDNLPPSGVGDLALLGLGGAGLLYDAKIASLGVSTSLNLNLAGSAVRYTPLGIGPLDAAIANTFRGGSYTATTLAEATTLYRVYGGSAGKVGSYWTRTKPSGPLQVQLDSALVPQWGNTATNVVNIRVPKGTTIYEGAAAPQSTGVGQIMGGGNQVYIPRIDPKWIY